MRTLYTVIALFGLTNAVFAQPDPKDRKGCADSPVLSRMSGCFIYSCRTSDYDVGQFRVKAANNKTEDLKVEGASEEINYHCAPKTSMIEIIRNVEGALKAGGFTVRWQMDGANWAAVTGQKGPQWVYVQSRNASYMLRTVRAKGLDQQMAANADGWAKQIEQTGRASIYGINFDTGKASIRPDSEKVLNEVLALLQKNGTWRMAVAGHTDNVGAKEMNLALSRQRAQSVAGWLTGHGVVADRLLPGGFGDLAPVAENATEDGRAKNRRVDLIKLY
jgi:outer membrane protein OmpA-like peptidoglycan-associated protein